MGNRLSKIYTRAGDKGNTGLGDGRRVSKDSPRIEAIGSIDELNSTLGLLLAQALPESARACLSEVQHRLFDLGGELSLPGHEGAQGIRAGDIDWLEQRLDAFNGGLPPLRDFILPGGGQAAAICHMARAQCRRAERRLVALAAVEALRTEPGAYLNRLSDLLFVLARVLARHEGGREVLWQPRADA